MVRLYPVCLYTVSILLGFKRDKCVRFKCRHKVTTNAHDEGSWSMRALLSESLGVAVIEQLITPAGSQKRSKPCCWCRD
jgi:hypothetical protein